MEEVWLDFDDLAIMQNTCAMDYWQTLKHTQSKNNRSQPTSSRWARHSVAQVSRRMTTIAEVCMTGAGRSEFRISDRNVRGRGKE
jgi:hypothetical protein